MKLGGVVKLYGKFEGGLVLFFYCDPNQFIYGDYLSDSVQIVRMCGVRKCHPHGR